MPKIDRALLFFALFPYIGFFPGVDVQPVFIFLALFFLLISNVKVPLAGIVFLFLSSAVFGGRILFQHSPADLFSILSLSVGLVTPLVMFLLVRDRWNVLPVKILWLCLFLYLCVGVANLFYPKFLAGLVQRDNIDLLLETNRGVRSLTGEPSDFGRIILVFNFLLVFQFLIVDKSKSVSWCFWSSIFLLALNVVLTQSFYAAAFHFAFLCLFVFFFSFKHAIFLLIFTGLGIGLLLPLMGGGRFALIYTALFEDFDLILQQGAFSRVVNVPISIVGGLLHGPFGAGVSDRVVSGTLDFGLFSYGFEVGERSLGGVVEYFLRFGVISLPVFMIYFYFVFSVAKVRVYLGRNRYLAGLFGSIMMFCLSFLDGSPANPLTWLCFFYVWAGLKSLSGASQGKGVPGNGGVSYE